MEPVFDSPVVADGLRAKSGRQQELADKIGDFAGRLPQPGGRDVFVRGARDADDRADVIRPFSIDECALRIKHLDPARLVTGMLVLVAGGVMIDGSVRRARLFDTLN